MGVGKVRKMVMIKQLPREQDWKGGAARSHKGQTQIDQASSEQDPLGEAVVTCQQGSEIEDQ